MAGASKIDLNRACLKFEAADDFTAGLEEEFALIDPETLDLVQRFEELSAAADAQQILSDSLAGELISSEVEIRSGRGADFTEAVNHQLTKRAALFTLAEQQGVGLLAVGTHPWAIWQDQRIIDTPHYQRVEDELQYVAWRNNTFSVHIHVGINGPDRAIAVCDRLRRILPELLALSANSAYLDGRFSGLHSVRSQIFTKSFPRCGIPEPFGDWRRYAEHIEFLIKTRSIIESTQLWWSVRPHHSFGTVEIRICDAQSRGEESLALAALMYGAVVQAALDFDEGRPYQELPNRLIEENLWRAIRYGLDGKLIDFESAEEVEARATIERLIDWMQPARDRFDLDPYIEPLNRTLSEGNGAQRQWQRNRDGLSQYDGLRAIVEETNTSYVTQQVPQ